MDDNVGGLLQRDVTHFNQSWDGTITVFLEKTVNCQKQAKPLATIPPCGKGWCDLWLVC